MLFCSTSSMPVRIKLIFDGVDIKKCMFLVDANHQLIKDLQRRIRKRFSIEKSLKLCLFIDDFVLNSEDGIELIHDDDVIVVRVRSKSEGNEPQDSSTVEKKNKKRKRKWSENNEQKIAKNNQSKPYGKLSGDKNQREDKLNAVCKKTKVELNANDTIKQVEKKKTSNQNEVSLVKRTGKESVPKSQIDHESRKNNSGVNTTNKDEVQSSSVEKVTNGDCVLKNICSTKIAKRTTESHSSSSDGDSSSSSSSDDNQKTKPVIKWNIKQVPELPSNKQNDDVQLKTGNKIVKVREVKKTGETKHIFFESDSESDDDDDDDDTDVTCVENNVDNSVDLAEGKCGSKENSWMDETEEEDENKEDEALVMDVPKEPLEVIKKPPTAPVRDYSKLQPLIGPPRVGDVIGYKVLELSASYMPEVSEYKEGKVVDYDIISQCVTLELCEGFTSNENARREGRFEMEMDEEYMDNVQNENKVCVQWSMVMTPRLIV